MQICVSICDKEYFQYLFFLFLQTGRKYLQKGGGITVVSIQYGPFLKKSEKGILKKKNRTPLHTIYDEGTRGIFFFIQNIASPCVGSFRSCCWHVRSFTCCWPSSSPARRLRRSRRSGASCSRWRGTSRRAGTGPRGSRRPCRNARKRS